MLSIMVIGMCGTLLAYFLYMVVLLIWDYIERRK
jgi:hypothetical protein